MVDLVDVLRESTDEAERTLTPLTGGDWRTLRAADLEWTCLDTLIHVLDDLYFYATSLLLGSRERAYVPLELKTWSEDEAGPAELVRALPIHGELLARVVRGARPEDRGFHSSGVSDPAGFAAMGAVETLVHTYDLERALAPAQGEAAAWVPPDHLAGPVLDRLFPGMPEGPPGEVLLWACGRIAFGDRPRREEWRWDSSVR